MPHVPDENVRRRYAPTSKEPTPAWANVPGEKEPRTQLFGKPISPHKHTVNVDTVIEHLFGRKLNVDPHTGVCDLRLAKGGK